MQFQAIAPTFEVELTHHTHPGVLLLEQIGEMGLSVNRVARDIRLPATRLHEIVHERRGVTAETAIAPCSTPDYGALPPGAKRSPAGNSHGEQKPCWSGKLFGKQSRGEG